MNKKALSATTSYCSADTLGGKSCIVVELDKIGLKINFSMVEHLPVYFSRILLE